MVETGTANLASMRAGLTRAGAAVRPARDPEDVRDADFVLLPGVGAFAAARGTLAASGLDAALRDRIERDRPTLCVCVGLQVLAEASEESPGVAGLGVVAGVVRRFEPCADAAAPVRVPQMGWNRIEAGTDCRLLATGDVYFANSYALSDSPAGWAAATATHGRGFVAGFERGSVVACQFHPELSGATGAAVLRRWLEGV
jgi:imidazole glycerol phosphate synthase glutamine amidotransferase subunit